MNKNKTEIQKVICRKILKYGNPVIRSEEFKKAYSQTHHIKGNLADHILNVTIEGVILCMRLKKHGIKVNEEQVILACLCHDLGMNGRDRLYKNWLASWQMHPRVSARRARRILPNMDSTTEQAIESHMWPIAGDPPTTDVGFLVLLADKAASVTDWISFVQGKPWQQEIKEKIRSVAFGS